MYQNGTSNGCAETSSPKPLIASHRQERPARTERSASRFCHTMSTPAKQANKVHHTTYGSTSVRNLVRTARIHQPFSSRCAAKKYPLAKKNHGTANVHRPQPKNWCSIFAVNEPMPPFPAWITTTPNAASALMLRALAENVLSDSFNPCRHLSSSRQ